MRKKLILFLMLALFGSTSFLRADGTSYGPFVKADKGYGPAATVFRDTHWHFYDDGVNESAVGVGGGEFYWAIMFPGGSYTDTAVLKVAVYDYDVMTGTAKIYQGGSDAPAGAALGSVDITLTGLEDYVEFDFTSPVYVDPTQNLWVVLHHVTGASYTAATTETSNTPNGRWVSLDGVEWDDLADYGINGNWMVRILMAGEEPLAAGTDAGFIDFEDQDLSMFINDASYPWTVVTPAYTGYNGSYAMMSGNSGVSSSQSSIEINWEFTEDGFIKFLGGIWGEGTSTYWDKCLFYIDGVQQFEYGALDMWKSFKFEVLAGVHNFKWSYTKDSSVNPTGDCFMVDDIQFGLASEVIPEEFIQIGNGTTTAYQLPINHYFNYSCTQQIFTADEIGRVGTINSISFYYKYGTPYTAAGVKMYMKLVDRTSFADNTDFETITADDLVWEGALAPTEEGWVNLVLDTPLEYNGTSNLLVAFYDPTSGYQGNNYNYLVTETTDNMALCYFSDSYNPDPYNLSSYSGSKYVYQYRNNILLEVIPDYTNYTGVITVGEGEQTANTLPTSPFYNYTLSEMIYRPDEIGAAGKITKFGFHYQGTSAMDRDVVVYMKRVAKNNFNDDTAWEPLTEADIVYEGHMTANGNEWVTFNLLDPFIYDGTSNIMFAFDDNTGAWVSGQTFYYTPTSDTTCKYYRSDGTNPDPYNPPTSGVTYSKNRPDLQLTFDAHAGVWEPNYDLPMEQIVIVAPAIAAANVMDPVTLEWDNDNNACECKVEFGTVYGNLQTIFGWDTIIRKHSTLNIADLGITLQPNVRYYWKVYNRNNTGEINALGVFLSQMTTASNVRVTADEIFTDESTVVKWTIPGNGMDMLPETTIGSGTTNNSELPSNSYWKYGYSQQIYTGAEIGGAGFINSISFFNGGSEQKRLYNVYLLNTEKTAFNDSIDWFQVSQEDLVYSDSVDFVANAWTTLSFEYPFVFDGTNLAVIVDDNTGSYQSGLNCRVFDAANQALYVRGDATNYDPFDTTTYVGTRLNVKNQIKINANNNSKNSRDLLGCEVYLDGALVNVDGLVTGYEYTLSNLTYNMEGRGHYVNVVGVTELGKSMFSDTAWVRVSDYTTVTGTVKELMSGEIVIGAAVQLEGHDEFDNPQTYATVSDSLGNFEIDSVKLGVYDVKAILANHDDAVYQDTLIAFGVPAVFNMFMHEVYAPVYKVYAVEETVLGNTVADVLWSFSDFADPGRRSVNTKVYSEEDLIKMNSRVPSELLGNVKPMPAIPGLTRGNTAYSCCVYDGSGPLPEGWISYDVDAPTAGTLLNSSVAVYGGDYAADGFVYSTDNNGTWYKINPETGAVEASGSLGAFFVDCAYDYTTDVMYGSYSGALYTWDLANNTVASVGEMPESMQMIACDLDGQLYGLSYGTGIFYAIDKATAACTVINSNTGFAPAYVQGGGFDHNTGKLYWAGIDYGSSVNFVFAEIDKTTGVITQLANNVGEQCSWCVPYTYNGGSNGGSQQATDDHYFMVYRMPVLLDTMASPDNIEPTLLAEVYGLNFSDTLYSDHEWRNLDKGVYQYGVSAVYPWMSRSDNNVTPITWSNRIDKDMTTTLVINPSINTGSIEGAVLSLTNVNEAGIEYNVEFTNTNIITNNEFRRGNYELIASLDGYRVLVNDIDVTNDTVPFDLWMNNPVLIVNFVEDLAPITTLEVSHTGFARWNNMMPVDRTVEHYHVMCDDVFQGETENNYMILNTEGFVDGETYTAQVAVVYSTGFSDFVEADFVYYSCDSIANRITDLAAEVDQADVNLTWTPVGEGSPYLNGGGGGGSTGDVTVILNVPNNLWSDNSGYQMLLDETHSLYGTVIPTSGALSMNCSGNESIYEQFSHKIPENADGNCSTSNMVNMTSVSINIPAGTYDWCITNPSPGDRIWIASAQGNVGGRQDDYVFESGNTYEFVVTMQGSNDAVNVTVNGRHQANHSMNISNEECRVNTLAKNGIFTAISGEPIVSNWAFADDGNWYYYDDGTFTSAIGTSGGGQFYWGIMLPAGSINGTAVTKAAVYDYMATSGTVTIYNDGATAPAEPVGSTNITFTGSEDFVEVEFETPVTIDPTKNVWVIVHNTANATYPMAGCDNTGDANGRWVSLDGSEWEDISSYGLDVTWMVRAYIEEGNGGGSTPFSPGNFHIFLDGELVGITPDPAFTYTAEDDLEHEYTVVYVDEDYNFSCSESIIVAADPLAIGQYDIVSAIYPNPTSGDLYITTTASMKNISIVNALGQVVYNEDTEGTETRIDMAKFGNGLYMVNIVTVNGTSTHRIIVNK